MLTDIKLEDIFCQKVLSKIITLSMEKKFMTIQLILI